MTWLLAVLLVGLAAGWAVSAFAAGPVQTGLSWLVLAMVLGALPLGRYGRRVMLRSRD